MSWAVEAREMGAIAGLGGRPAAGRGPAVDLLRELPRGVPSPRGLAPWAELACESAPVASPKPRLLDRVRAALRLRHYSRRTEQAYVHWIRRFILFHGKRRHHHLHETVLQLLESHPRLTREGVLAALRYAAQVLRAEVVYPVGARSA